ncbi:MAG: MarR family transcriptional regulator [Bacteroidia bacterium]|nr:MarR family transcriptional regulator [Bacteroidia bacterium]
MIGSIDPVSVTKLESAILAVNHFFRMQEDFVQKRHGISSLEMDILQLVCRKGPLKMKEIAAHYQLKLSTLTSVVDKAETHGILRRSTSKEDRRVVLVEAEEAGRIIFADYLSHIQSVLDKFLHKIPNEQKDHLFRGFGTFLSAYDF